MIALSIHVKPNIFDWYFFNQSLILICSNQARPRDTRHGTGSDTRDVSWLGLWAPSKAPWHTSWHRRWHMWRVLALLMGTKQGLVARVTCLDSTCEHHARPHGTGGGTRHVSWLNSWAPCKASWHVSWHRWLTCLGSAHGHYARPRDTRHGTGGGTRHVFWLDLWAPSKAPWHTSWHGRWHASHVLAQLMVDHVNPSPVWAWIRRVGLIKCDAMALGTVLIYSYSGIKLFYNCMEICFDKKNKNKNNGS